MFQKASKQQKGSKTLPMDKKSLTMFWKGSYERKLMENGFDDLKRFSELSQDGKSFSTLKN